MRRSSGYNTVSLAFPPFPPSIKWLVGINVAIYLVSLLGQLSIANFIATRDYWLGLVPVFVVHGRIWQLITYSFLHTGLWHVLFNMLMLWMFGAEFEMGWGSRRFLEFYLFCAVGAALVTVAFAYIGFLLSPATITIGASGGVFGILLAFGMVYGDREVFMFPLPFRMRAKYMVGILLFIEIALVLQGPSGVANIAHLGGALFGFLYVRFMPRYGVVGGASEQLFGLRNAYYRWKRRRAAKKFEVYMRKHDRSQYFDEYGNFRDPDKQPPEKGNGEHRGPWVN
ncbi:MAG TPA: rhomboid family intramembrane serine protease [Terriglobales bacterium]|jgi:membrane associated rhomboid family serine protease|nr:rhomboid family intramembrane serine protease [Terriglobales bacterium]